jgi:hypothetical protein
MSTILERGGFNATAKRVVADEVTLDEWATFNSTGDVSEVEVFVAAPRVGNSSKQDSWLGKKRGVLHGRHRIKMPTFIAVRLAAGRTA